MKKSILKQLGFEKNWIYEVIITTEHNGKADAAPMGISSPDCEKIKVSVYKTAQTCRNISETGFFTLNFTADISIFYGSLFEKKKVLYAHPRGFILPALKKADAYIEARVISEKESGEKIIFMAEVVGYNKKVKKGIKLINRAQSLALEALIKSSKIQATKNRSEKRRLQKELRYIAHASSKTAPGSPQARMVSKLSSLFPG